MRLVSSFVALITLVFIMPASVFAFPFGGQASVVIPCYNNAIYANLGPPRGGPFVWTLSTKTYSFGPPSHAGQWLLGNAGPLYLCLVTIDPIFTLPATAILMMGSSQ
jgi:hypothetical protein